MKLHDQAVVEAHRRHLRQHLAAEEVRLFRREVAGDDLVEERRGVGARKVCGLRRGMPVVGRGRALRLEEVAPLPVRLEIAAPRQRVAVGDVAKPHDVGGEVRVIRIDDRIGPIGRDDAAAPVGLPDRIVLGERIERAVGRRDDLDVEALVERARTEFGRLERRRDLIEIEIGDVA